MCDLMMKTLHRGHRIKNNFKYTIGTMRMNNIGGSNKATLHNVITNLPEKQKGVYAIVKVCVENKSRTIPKYSHPDLGINMDTRKTQWTIIFQTSNISDLNPVGDSNKNSNGYFTPTSAFIVWKDSKELILYTNDTDKLTLLCFQV